MKCSAWESPFLTRINQARDKELANLWRVSIINAIVLFVLYGEEGYHLPLPLIASS